MFKRFREFERRYVFNFNKDGGDGQGNAGGGSGTGAGGAQKTDSGMSASEKAELEALRKEKADWSSKKDQDDQTLNDKVKKEKEGQDKKNLEIKALESAILFNSSKSDFLKQNESILPKGAAEIFAAADKERYDSHIDKSNDIKIGLIDLHFSQQSNVDFLTEYQKEALADFQKLTKNGKKEKANEIYNNLFIPNLNIIKQVKKTEELAKAKSGFGGNTDAEQAYKNKLTEMAQKKFFREKN